MTYEETIELEKNVKIKNRAEAIYNKFISNVNLSVEKHKGNGRFLFWADEHNSTYFRADGDHFVFECRFLHETYNVEVTPSGIFMAIKNDHRGVLHLESAVRDKD